MNIKEITANEAFDMITEGAFAKPTSSCGCGSDGFC